MKKLYVALLIILILALLYINNEKIKLENELDDLNNKIVELEGELLNNLLVTTNNTNIMMSKLCESIKDINSEEWQDPFYKIQTAINFTDLNISVITLNLMSEKVAIKNEVIKNIKSFKSILDNEYALHFDNIGKSSEISELDKQKAIELKTRITESNLINNNNSLDDFNKNLNNFIKWK